MTDLTEKQQAVMKALKLVGSPMPYKGLELVNILRSLDKLGLAHKDEKGEWWATAQLAPESPIEPRTATKAKAAILPSERPKKASRTAAEPPKAPAPKEEPKPYEPTEQYLSIMDEKQNRIGFIVEREALFFALNTNGQLVNRGISPASAEKRFRQLTKR